MSEQLVPLRDDDNIPTEWWVELFVRRNILFSMVNTHCFYALAPKEAHLLLGNLDHIIGSGIAIPKQDIEYLGRLLTAAPRKNRRSEEANRRCCEFNAASGDGQQIIF